MASIKLISDKKKRNGKGCYPRHIEVVVEFDNMHQSMSKEWTLTCNGCYSKGQHPLYVGIALEIEFSNAHPLVYNCMNCNIQRLL